MKKFLTTSVLFWYLFIITIGLTLGFTIVYSYHIILAIVIGLFCLYLAAKMAKICNFDTMKIKIIDLFIFLALFSGPPRPRSRDPLASFRGELDAVVIIYLAAWFIGFIWSVLNIISSSNFSIKFRSFGKLHVIALFFAFTLFASVLVSPVPLISGFRAFQVIVMIVFSYIYVEKYGVNGALYSIIYGYILMAITIALAALFSPELVYAGSRLRGDYIASAGSIGALGLILLLSTRGFKSYNMHFLLIPLLIWILAASRTRSAYGAFLLFLVLNILKAPQLFKLKLLRTLLILSMPLIIIYSDNVLGWLIREQGTISTLSDRTRIWSSLFYETMNSSPWLGLGYFSERLITLSVNPGIGTAHGTLALIFAGAGILGIITFTFLLVLAFYLSFRFWLQWPQEPLPFLIFCLLIAISSIGFVSEEMVVPGPSAVTFFMLLSLLPKSARDFNENINGA